MNVIFLGAPGAGKGTQAEIVSTKLGIPTISTGAILRENVKRGTEIGLAAKHFMDAGQLVPDEVIVEIVKERVAQDDCKNGYILDGMPRTIPQAEALLEHGVIIDKAISIEIADEIIEGRMTGRRTCHNCGASYHITANPSKVEGICDSCGGELEIRKDDEPETVKKRLVEYHLKTEPLKIFYKDHGVLVTIEGNQPIENATKDILAALGV